MSAGAVVAGALANKAGQGGSSWVRLSWAQGLRQLGFDVHLVEELADGAPYDAPAYFAKVVDAFGIEATLLGSRGETLHGLPLGDLVDACAQAAVLLDISGHLRRPELRDVCRRRVYVDLDPGYTQLWHHAGLLDLGDHDHWYTVGLNVGTPACRVPTDGVPWRPVLPPVVLDDWPDVAALALAENDVARPRFTTVASWRGGIGTVELDGRWLGGKAREFRRLLPLAERVAATLELALEIFPGDHRDRDALLAHGWHLADPATVAGDPFAFRDYVQRSFAELSVAQEAYVATDCGWFSDRTTRYLASGRPAVVQETGFSRDVPVGEGVLAFHDLAGAATAIRAIVEEPERHARAARALAEEHFSADLVLGRMCEELGVAP